MRKSAYIASAALVALTATFAACSSKEADDKATEKATLEQPAKQKAAATDSTGAHETALAKYVRYVDSEKILTEFSLAKEVAQADSTAQIKLAALQSQLGTKLQKQAQGIQEKAQRNGYLSEASYNADMTALQKAQQDAEATIAQRQRDYATDMMNKQQQLNDSVMNVVNYICRKEGYDAVLKKDAGFYFNPALDITDAVLAELNKRYKPAKK